MWSGSIASIPSGWVLCNGSNGTPDLRDRFIIGATQDSGGQARTNVTGSLTQTGGSKDAIVVSHTHTASSSVTDPGHTHTANIVNEILAGGPFSTVRPVALGSGTIGMTTATTGISVATSVSTTGSSGTNQNLPPYYALAFIMKT
jgi:microcystin-dependent protein